MTTETCMERIRSMMPDVQEQILKEAELLLRDSVDPSKAEDNFRLPKAVLVVAMRDAARQWEGPYGPKATRANLGKF